MQIQKKTQKTPAHEIRRAMKLMNAYNIEKGKKYGNEKLETD